MRTGPGRGLHPTCHPARGEPDAPARRDHVPDPHGVAQAPGGPQEDPSGDFPSGGWLVPHADETFGQQMDTWFLGAEDFLLGRRTYGILAAHRLHAVVTAHRRVGEVVTGPYALEDTATS